MLKRAPTRNLRISERQGEARGAALSEAHGSGHRDEAGRADRVHKLRTPPHVQELSEGDDDDLFEHILYYDYSSFIKKKNFPCGKS